ncbi:MAG TPA: DUF6455 family protein [Alphaproteobacteria bacterium]|nr:DUF6455 family protein [Alphaproteobacteria bacterium]
MESKREADGGMCARPGYDADGKMHAIFAFTKRYAHEAIDALKAWRERQVLANKLNNLDDGLLLDIGVVRGLIPRFVDAHPAAANQLQEMLERLGLDTKEHPLDDTERDVLYRGCVMCDHRRRCRRWLATTTDKKGYRAFCPNVRHFDALQRSAAPNKLQ